MNLEIPVYVSELMQKLNQSGYECYIVGGAIRSLLLGRPVHDYDLTTSALPEQMKLVFKDYKLIETGIQHGTVTVLNHHEPVEITTYRKDSAYEDHRHPDTVCFTSSIQEDCARRDFTVNAFCYNPQTGILDFFNGRDDLNHKVIRCIGDPYKRFDEDALRILRAIRFAAQLHFTIEENTQKALLDLKDSLSYVSMERIQEEFRGFLKAETCGMFLYSCRSVFSVFLPELQNMQEEEWNTLLRMLKTAANDEYIRMAVLLSCSVFAKPAEVLKRMKYDNHTISMICDLILHRNDPVHTRIEIRYLLKNLKADFREYLSYREAIDERKYIDAWELYEDIISHNECYRLKDLCINGNDVKNAGYQGKEISLKLDQILNAVIEGKLENDRQTLLACLVRTK